MKLDKKRRLKSKTNYTRRRILLKGDSPRLVVRKTNRQIIVQIIESESAKDKIIYAVNSKELLKYGWPKENSGSLKSIPAAYLSGVLIAKKAEKLKSKIILDLGLIPHTKGSKIYAVIKAIKDSGMNIDFDEKIIPSEERITGKDSKIKEDIFKKIKENILK